MRYLTIHDIEEELVSLDDGREYLGLQPDDDGNHPDDTKVMAMLSGARNVCEEFTGLAFGRKTLEVAMADFPDGVIELPAPPLVGVISITVDGVEMDAADYEVDTYSQPGRVLPADTWPTTLGAVGSVKIRYACGYGVDTDGGEAIPPMAKIAILMTLGSMYDGTEKPGEIPMAVDAMLRPLRMRLGAA